MKKTTITQLEAAEAQARDLRADRDRLLAERRLLDAHDFARTKVVAQLEQRVAALEEQLVYAGLRAAGKL